MFVFWFKTPYTFVGRYQRLGSPEDGENTFLRNDGIILQVRTALKTEERRDIYSLICIKNRKRSGGKLWQEVRFPERKSEYLFRHQVQNDYRPIQSRILHTVETFCTATSPSSKAQRQLLSEAEVKNNWRFTFMLSSMGIKHTENFGAIYFMSSIYELA
jgi:hypothetical protein